MGRAARGAGGTGARLGERAAASVELALIRAGIAVLAAGLAVCARLSRRGV